MKLLLFAHKPPPHHGQSYMVQLLLDVLGGDRRQPAAASQSETGRSPIDCYHVDCRFSDDTEDIGKVRWKKVALLLKYCAEAIWCRFRYGVTNFIYIPAPGLRSAIYRDWLVMACLRPFFRRRIHYWQAAGLGDWLTREARPWERWVTLRLLARADLDIVLGESTRRDAEVLRSARIEIVPNSVADPCPQFDQTVLLDRQARAAQCSFTNAEARSFRVLFMSLCLREKGLFDAVEAVALVNQELKNRNAKFRVSLDVAGKFWHEHERVEFEERIKRPDLQNESDGTTCVSYHGFVSGEEKKRLLRECDCLCFPTYYWAESFPLVLVEAMGFGLPIITTRWRSIPELLPPDYPGVVEPQSPKQIVGAILALLGRPYDGALRDLFLKRYTKERYSETMRAVLRSIEPESGHREGSHSEKPTFSR